MHKRLLAIIYLLMSRGTVTASELASRFEVSQRTIYRDVEALSMAGIPIYTKKGKYGGICLTEQFVLNKMLITEEEQEEILAGLTGLKETGADPGGETLQKLGEFFKREPKDWVTIDLSDWSGQRGQLFELLKQAILREQVIEFDYYGQSGEMTVRQAEPLQLMFKDYTWYLRAFCLSRMAVRVFKLMRMKRVRLTGENFETDRDGLLQGKDADVMEKAQTSWKAEKLVKVRLLLEASEAYRIYDRFEEEEITRQEDGRFLVGMDCILDDWTYGMILSYGPSVTVLDPPEVKQELRIRLERMMEKLSE